MHFRKPRRSIPSWLWSCKISSFLFCDICRLLGRSQPAPERRNFLTAQRLKVARACCEPASNAPPVDVFTVQDLVPAVLFPGRRHQSICKKIVSGGNKLTPIAVTSTVEL